MIIQIDDDLFHKVKQIVKGRNLSLYEYLEKLQPLTTDTTLTKARAIKSQKVKQSIHQAIKELLQSNISPTRYQIHKKTNIAYVTINKYFDEVINEARA